MNVHNSRLPEAAYVWEKGSRLKIKSTEWVHQLCLELSTKQPTLNTERYDHHNPLRVLLLGSVHDRR